MKVIKTPKRRKGVSGGVSGLICLFIMVCVKINSDMQNYDRFIKK